MKNIFAMTAALLMGFGASANNVELVVESVDNGGCRPGPERTCTRGGTGRRGAREGPAEGG